MYYRNIFECTRRYRKQPDQGVIPKNPAFERQYRYSPLVVEVAFRNETNEVLLQEASS
jgi:hypothetical protein